MGCGQFTLYLRTEKRAEPQWKTAEAASTLGEFQGGRTPML